MSGRQQLGFKDPFEESSFPDQDETIILKESNKDLENRFKVRSLYTNTEQAIPFNPYQGSVGENINMNTKKSGPIQFDSCQEINNDDILNEEEPPLLEDIGINLQKIKERIIMVVSMKKPTQETLQDPDLSGPILIALSFGFLLMLSGKIHFGDIYAVFIIGNILVYIFFNLMSQVHTNITQSAIISFYNTMSTLGYSLLPMLLVSFLKILINMKTPLGIILGLTGAGWSSIAAANIMFVLIKEYQREEPKRRNILIIYPLFLFYVSFVMIVLF